MNHYLAITIVASLTYKAVSMAALSLSTRTIGFANPTILCQFYIGSAFVGKGNRDRARAVMQHVVSNLAQWRSPPEAITIAVEMQHQGLHPCRFTFECITKTACEMGVHSMCLRKCLK
ncbi:hypothetical protein Nepgr_005063 [Nepenthes gracilis]|uniref:Uncharacterized protein n=1 Tax=Nepenthes gracilis TaxID=150966 RepID=A0AAD3XFV7_NEPGR|nr:hypothetical protein Nepgr_005063 [Nepenthes gracilis]